MNEKYDVIICGTSLKEAMLTRLLQMKGMKVLHVDKNGYNCGETKSVGLDFLYNLFKPGQVPVAEYGSPKSWNVDLVPKFLMAYGTFCIPSS